MLSPQTLSPGFRISAACNSEVQLYNKYTLLGPKQESMAFPWTITSFPLEEQTQRHLNRHLLYTCSSSQSVSPPRHTPRRATAVSPENLLEMPALGLLSRPLEPEIPRDETVCI